MWIKYFGGEDLTMCEVIKSMFESIWSKWVSLHENNLRLDFTK